MKILTTQSAGQGRLPNIQRGVLGLCLALLCTMSLEASAQKFQITTVDPPGSIESGSTMINAAAVITGWYYDASGDHGFVRSPDGTFTSFDVPGAVFVVPASINSVGEIVGTTSYTGGGFLREPDGIITMLYGPGSIDLSPAAINDEGTIAGFFWAHGSDTGFVRSRNGTLTTFGVPGSQFTVPVSINAAGTTTGYYYDSNYIGRAFLRSRDGRFTTFIAPGAWNTSPLEAGCHYTTPTGINSAGEITGFYDDKNQCAEHGFVRHRDGTFTIIDTPGTDITRPVAMNAARTVIGWYSDGYTGQQRGFVRSKGVITKLDAPGASYTNPTCINNRGWITGDYNNHSFLAIPMDAIGHLEAASPLTELTE